MVRVSPFKIVQKPQILFLEEIAFLNDKPEGIDAKIATCKHRMGREKPIKKTIFNTYPLQNNKRKTIES